MSLKTERNQYSLRRPPDSIIYGRYFYQTGKNSIDVWKKNAQWFCKTFFLNYDLRQLLRSHIIHFVFFHFHDLSSLVSRFVIQQIRFLRISNARTISYFSSKRLLIYIYTKHFFKISLFFIIGPLQ